MNLLRQPSVRAFCLCVFLAVMPGAATAMDLPPAGLRTLAVHNTQPEAWARLRSYAKTQTDPEWSGWAFFLAGYQEYQGKIYAQSALDLAHAAKSGFSLSDYAVFYQASALRAANQAQDAATALQDFSTRFPHSPLQSQALTLRVTALLSIQQAQAAIDYQLRRLFPSLRANARPAMTGRHATTVTQ